MDNLWLVVDTNVLVDASGQGIKEFAKTSHELLRALAMEPKFALALDLRGKIHREYRARIRAPMFAFHWLEKLGKEVRLRPVDSTEIPKGTRVSLAEAHFDTKDLPLVQAAYHSHKLIVTRDYRCFSARVKKILRRKIEVGVVSAGEMLDLLSQENVCQDV